MADNSNTFPSGDFAGCEPDRGMTLRDWFAGQALSGYMANTKRPTAMSHDDAAWCYIIADAMLAERGRELAKARAGEGSGE